MKWIVLVLSLTTITSFAQSNPQDCLKIKNNLDRKYCIDKYLESVKNKNDADKKTWTTLNQKSKDEKAAGIEADIQAKKEWMKLIESEIALSERQLTDLKAAPIAATAPAKKEKKKKKGGFRIKL